MKHFIAGVEGVRFTVILWAQAIYDFLRRRRPSDVKAGIGEILGPGSSPG